MRRSARLGGASRILAAVLLLAGSPAAAAARGGAAVPRTAPELSDLALFAFAAIALWLTRRALRRRTGAPKD